jgi:hypothetical protein
MALIQAVHVAGRSGGTRRPPSPGGRTRRRRVGEGAERIVARVTQRAWWRPRMPPIGLPDHRTKTARWPGPLRWPWQPAPAQLWRCRTVRRSKSSAFDPVCGGPGQRWSCCLASTPRKPSTPWPPGRAAPAWPSIQDRLGQGPPCGGQVAGGSGHWLPGHGWTVLGSGSTPTGPIMRAHRRASGR